jgi:glycerol-3-phosphate dehydrogenase
VLRCGALVQPLDDALEIPGEAVTDPVAYTLALAAEAERHGAEVHTGVRVDSVHTAGSALRIGSASGVTVRCQVAVNCAGLQADSIARLAGEESFSIYPRKGEFLVFEPPAGEPLERILMPVHTKRTRGVLVFPTIDGKIVAGPTAVDFEDKHDWSVRASAREEIISKAAALYPPLAGAEPVFAYAGLRPAGRDVNYLIGPASRCPGLIHVAAIRSTGLSASLGIAEHVTSIVGSLGVSLGPEAPLIGGPAPRSSVEWWRRTAEYRAVATA